MKRIAYAALAALMIVAGDARGAEIGAVAAVNRDVKGARPAEPPRRLILNEKLIQNERVTTSENSGGQVLFLDQTTLTLTPNSDIILDKYVFNPDADTGELAVTMLRGAMRMVGGRITKSSAATIKTPSATIGIRGGIGNIAVREDGSTEYMHIAGFSATISSSNGDKVTITREGGMAEVSAPAGGPASFAAAALGGAGQTAPTSSERQQTALAEGRPTGEADGDAGAGDNTEAGASTAAEEANTGADANASDGGKITYLGVATPEMVRQTMSVRPGQGGGGTTAGAATGPIQNGVARLGQDISGRPNAVAEAPLSTTGERQEQDYAAPPPRLDDRPIEEFTANEVAMATEAEAAAQAVAQELNAISFSGAWAATAGLNNGGFGATENDLAFRMQYSLLDQEGFVTVQLPGGQDGAALTTFDGAAVLGDRFLIVGDDARNLIADADRLTLLGGDADGTALIINASDIADGSIFVDYEGVGLSEIQFVDGRIVGLDGQRLTTAEIRDLVSNLQQTLPAAAD